MDCNTISCNYLGNRDPYHKKYWCSLHNINRTFAVSNKVCMTFDTHFATNPPQWPNQWCIYVEILNMITTVRSWHVLLGFLPWDVVLSCFIHCVWLLTANCGMVPKCWHLTCTWCLKSLSFIGHTHTLVHTHTHTHTHILILSLSFYWLMKLQLRIL